MGEAIYGHKAWGYVLPIIIVVYVSGSLASYSIAIMDNMFWWSDVENHPKYKTYKIILCICILYGLVVPLSCLKNLDFMKFNSFVTIICEVYVMIVIICYFFIYDGNEG